MSQRSGDQLGSISGITGLVAQFAAILVPFTVKAARILVPLIGTHNLDCNSFSDKNEGTQTTHAQAPVRLWVRLSRKPEYWRMRKVGASLVTDPPSFRQSAKLDKINLAAPTANWDNSTQFERVIAADDENSEDKNRAAEQTVKSQSSGISIFRKAKRCHIKRFPR